MDAKTVYFLLKDNHMLKVFRKETALVWEAGDSGSVPGVAST